MKETEARIRKANPSLTWITPRELLSRDLGRLLQEVETADTKQFLDALALPEKVAYVASESGLEECVCVPWLRDVCFGEMPIQVGYCIGHNRRLNALEFHMGSEVLLAGTDLVLLLDSATRVANSRYSPQTLLALYVCEGQAIELFGRTLHFAPLEVSNEGFRAAIVLPRGTNLPLEGKPEGLLFAKNKWLIAHPESPSAQRGAKVGIVGENIELVIPAP